MGADDLLWAAEVLLGRWYGRGDGGTEAQEAQVRADLRVLAAKQDVADEAKIARSRKLESLGSVGSFFGGLVKIAEVVRPVMVVATPTEFVLLDADVAANPAGELGHVAKRDVRAVRIVDENGNDVADFAIDPIRELDTPEAEKYSVVFDRADGSATSVSFLFLSGEPALFARDRFRRHLAGDVAG